MSDVATLLRGVSIFSELDARTLAALAARCVPRTVGSGFVLFRTGDRCHGLYLVLDGRVRVFRTSPDGREQTLALEGAGRVSTPLGALASELARDAVAKACSEHAS